MKDLQKYIDILPQQFPFRMIDEIIEYKEGESLTALKNITGSEWAYEGKKYKLDVFPETLIIEAAAQTALILYHIIKIRKTKKSVFYRMGKLKTIFKLPVTVGDQLIICANASKLLDDGGYSKIKISVANRQIANMELYYSVEDQKL